MADSIGKLSDAEKQKISETIEAIWKGRSEACPICGNTQWLIADHLVATTTLGHGGAFQLGGQVYPFVMLISPCGYTRLFNAVMLGIRPNAKPSVEAIQPTEVEKK
jgi:hypothetical protein